MIRYALKCSQDHVFEAWFRDSASFDAQQSKGALSCPICNGKDIQKALMTPGLGAKRQPAQAPDAQNSAPPPQGEVAQDIEKFSAEREAQARAFKAFRAHIEATTEDVGRNFADEARRIHHGESPQRGIRGQATPQEATDLRKEGVPAAPLPWIDPDSKN